MSERVATLTSVVARTPEHVQEFYGDYLPYQALDVYYRDREGRRRVERVLPATQTESADAAGRS